MEHDDRGVRRIKLNGARFDGGRLPIDSLVELERYQDLLRLIARAEWQADNPGEPLPPGFDDEISLTIESIEEGSAHVFLAFEQHAVYVEYQQQADEALNGAIVAAYEARELPSSLPAPVTQEVREGIAELGGTLEGDQSIELFADGPSDEPVRITVTTRKAVIDQFALEDFLAPPPDELRGELLKHVETVVGRITEVDAERGSYRFESLQHGRLIGRYDKHSDMLDDIRKALDSPEEAPILRVQGVLQHKRDGSPWRFVETHLVEQFVAGSEPWAPRLAEFAQLPDGWGDEGEGRAISVAALEAAGKIMDAIAASDSPLPNMFATEDGGVILEWASRTLIRSIETSPDAVFEIFEMPRGGSGSLRTTSNLQEAIDFATGAKA